MSFGQHPGCAVQNSIGLADRNTLFKEDARKFLFQRMEPLSSALQSRLVRIVARSGFAVGAASLLAEEQNGVKEGRALAAGLLSMSVQDCLTKSGIENGATPLIEYLIEYKYTGPRSGAGDCGLLLSPKQNGAVLVTARRREQAQALPWKPK